MHSGTGAVWREGVEVGFRCLVGQIRVQHAVTIAARHSRGESKALAEPNDSTSNGKTWTK